MNDKTIEFINKVKDKNNIKHRDSLGNWLYNYDKVVYENVKKKVIITCKIHGDFLQTPDSHLQGQGCKACSKISMANKQSKTTEDFIKEAKDKHNDMYSYEKSKYINSKIKVIITCSIHGDFLQAPKSHISGAGCSACYGNVKYDRRSFIDKANTVHDFLYDYSEVNFINSTTEVKIICPIHGIFEQKPQYHIAGKGCASCSGGTKRTTETFIFNAKLVHGDKYIYDKTDYKSAHDKIIIMCPEHGYFEQTATNHLSGYGCLECSGKIRLTLDNFKSRSNEVHGDKYIYDNIELTGNRKSKVKILCPEHGYFEQRVDDHLQGQGCPTCSGNVRSNTEDFIIKATNIHNGLYGYDKVNYINNNTKVSIECPIHGYFEQVPATHLQGQGCNTCAKLLKGWSKTHFTDACNRNNKGLGILYVIRCFNDNESFYKIGITSKSVKARYASRHHMPYNYEELYVIQDEPSIIYDLENKLILQSAIYRYEPLIFFEGRTECISNLRLIEEQLKIA